MAILEKNTSFTVDTTDARSSVWFIVDDINKPTPRVWFGTSSSFFFGLAYNMNIVREGVYSFDLVRQTVTPEIVSYAGEDTRLVIGEYSIGEVARIAVKTMYNGECCIQITSGEVELVSKPFKEVWHGVSGNTRPYISYVPDCEGYEIITSLEERNQVEWLYNNPILNENRVSKIKELHEEEAKSHYNRKFNLTLFALFHSIPEVLLAIYEGEILIDIKPSEIKSHDDMFDHFPHYNGKLKLTWDK